MPSFCHAMRPGFSSNVLRQVGDGAARGGNDGDAAVREVVERIRHRRREGDLRAVRRPRRAALSGPSCFTSGRIFASATLDHRDVRRAAVGRVRVDGVVEGDLLAVRRPVEAAHGERRPASGACAFFDSRSMTHRCVRRWSASTISNSPYFLSRSFAASDFGSAFVKAICLPSGDHAKLAARRRPLRSSAARLRRQPAR